MPYKSLALFAAKEHFSFHEV